VNQENILKTLRDHYSKDIESVDFLRDGGCTTYIVIEKYEKYLLKIIGSAFSDTIMQAIDIMIYLRKHDVPVPKIINTEKGKPYIYAMDNGSEYLYVLYEFVDGKEPDIDDKAEEIGELTGKLHLLMQNYTGNLIVREKPFFIDRYINILRSKGYSEKETARYVTLGNQLWETVKGLTQGYCHGDLHRGKLLLTPDDKLYILDFDTSCRAPRMFDIMVMCDTTNYFDFDSKAIDYTTAIFNRFTEGYTKYILLSKIERKSFYDFIAIRHYQLQATIVEIYGYDCIEEQFIDKQLKWLVDWRKQYIKEFGS
jgi:Ser/Thr protein kinase RdoA (MazF antagonist)